MPTGRPLTTVSRILTACLLVVAGLALALPPVASASASAPKSQLECEHKYGMGTSWRRCFSEPPGSSCKHPLELQKASETVRGDHTHLTARFDVGADGLDANDYYYWWEPVNPKNVAICPHGVIYVVSVLSEEGVCETIHGEKYCTNELDIKRIVEPTTSSGGSLKYVLPVGDSAYLIVRGYYIHPPQRASGRSAQVKIATSPSKPKTVFQCQKAFKRRSSQRAACIKRLASEKPGSSCAHPLLSGMASDGASGGDTKDYTVTTKTISENPKSRPGPSTDEIEVIIHNPRVILCGVTVYETVTNPPAYTRENHVYHPTISPHGGLSSPVTEPERILYFSVVVQARYG